MSLSIIPLDKKWQACFVGAVLFVFVYLSAGYIGIANAVPLVKLYPDYAIPFMRWTIWIYISDYVFVPCAFFWVTKPDYYSAMLYAMIIATLTACLIFISYPTLMLREPLSNSFSDLARSLLYLIDFPTNCFPSLHVALAILAAFFIFKENRNWGFVSAIWTFLIAVSTMTIKQHYFVDVIGGFVLAVYALIMTRYLLRKSTS
jgi:membrane-associated phospholipid phosphatase